MRGLCFVLTVALLSAGNANGADDFIFTEAGGYATLTAPDADYNIKLTVKDVRLAFFILVFRGTPFPGYRSM